MSITAGDESFSADRVSVKRWEVHSN